MSNLINNSQIVKGKEVRIIILVLLLLLCNKSIYCQDASNQSKEKYNPEYHYYPSIDPTGLFYYDGLYYLNWGTATSKDLVHWKMTEYGLERNKTITSMFGGAGRGMGGIRGPGGATGAAPGAAGRVGDAGSRAAGMGGGRGFGAGAGSQSQVISIESGSVLVDRNNTTGLSQNSQPPLIAFQSRSIAYSNDSAKTWVKYENPPKIENGSGAGDPKVLWYEPDKKWVLLMGATSQHKVKFFSSKDMKNWEYLSEFGPLGAVSRAWNCVDFFPLAVDGNLSKIKWVLFISVQTFNGQYFIGDFDGKQFTLDKEYMDVLSDASPPPAQEYNPGWEKAFWADWGSDFYAARAWTNYAPQENRSIWVGWMGNHKYRGEPVLGCFSVPRSIELKTLPQGIRLIQNPIKELESLRGTHKTAEQNTYEGKWVPDKFSPAKNTYELIAEFENVSAEEFGLNLCVGGNEKTVVGYNASKGQLYVDRRDSGYDEFNAAFPSVSTGPLKNSTNTLKLHIFVDKCSIEVFGNNGETVISSKIYPDSASLGIELFSKNGKVKLKSLDMWELGSINLY
jgi:fructan beta-fructosidase